MSSARGLLRQGTEILTRVDKDSMDARLGKRNEITSREAVNAIHERIKALSDRNESLDNFTRFYYPPYYEPANPTTPVDRLKKIHAKDLIIGKHHKGTYLKIRLVSTPTPVENSMQTIYEDEQGSFGILRLYFRDGRLSTDDHMEPSRTMLVREPFLWDHDSLEAAILRVDHPYDAGYLYQWNSEHERLIPRPWKLKLLMETLDPKELLHLAEIFSQAGEWYTAITRYSQVEAAVNKSKTKAPEEVIARFRKGRAKAQLKLKHYDLSARDTEPLLKLIPDHEEALHLRALRLYYTRKYDLCNETLDKLLKRFPRSPQYLDLHTRTRQRQNEVKLGKYSWRAMRHESDKYFEDFKPLDHAEYVNAVKLKKTPKGRRIFTAREIKRGDLIMVCKAVAITPFDGDDQSQMFIFKDGDIDCDFGAGVALTQKLLEHIKMEPNGWYDKTLSLMEDGGYPISNLRFQDGNRVPDIFHIEEIRKHNQVTITNLPRHRLKARYKSPMNPIYHLSGIWVLPSYLRHSCSPNAHRTVIGDMMIIRAGRDIPANTKVTIDVNTPSVLTYPTLGFDCTCSTHQHDIKPLDEAQTEIDRLRAIVWNSILKEVDRIEKHRYSIQDKHKRLNLLEVFRNIDSRIEELKPLFPPPTKAPHWGIIYHLRYIACGYMTCGQRRHARCAMYKVLDAHGVLYQVDEDGDRVIFRDRGFVSDDLLDTYYDLHKLAQAMGIKRDWYKAAMEVYGILYGEEQSFPSVARGVEFAESSEQCGCIGVDNFFDATENMIQGRMGFNQNEYNAVSATPDGAAMKEIITSATEKAWDRILWRDAVKFHNLDQAQRKSKVQAGKQASNSSTAKK